jgi:hypothetical protein
MLFYGHAMVLRSYPAMAAGGWASITVPALKVRPNQNRRRIVVPRSLRSRRHELRAKTARLVVVLSLFLMLITAAVFIGGRSVIGPMLEKAIARAGDTHRKGAIVFTMPDGTFCRHLAFDNKTAELTESTVLQCPEARPRESSPSPERLCLGGALILPPWFYDAFFRRQASPETRFLALIATFRKTGFQFSDHALG